MMNLGFKRLKDAELFTFTGGVLQRMTTDAQFISLKPQSDVLKTAYDAYSISLTAAKLGGKDRLMERDARRADLLLELEMIAKSVDVLSRGEENIQIDAGFETRKTTAAKTSNVIPPPNFAVLNTERTGEVRLSWQTVDGALVYAIEKRAKGETAWQNGEYTSKREILLTDFEPGKCIEFRVRTLGRSEQKSDWTTVVSVWIA
jgi:hypothetical protein